MKKLILLVSLSLCLTACSSLEPGLERAKDFFQKESSQEGKSKKNKEESIFTKIKEVQNDTPLSKGVVGSVNGVDLFHEAGNHLEDPSLMIEGVNDFSGGKDLSQLTEVGDYLVDYEMGASMIRELLLKDKPHRYETKAEAVTPSQEDLGYALDYFNYLTEINTCLSQDKSFEGAALYPTLIWAKKYKDSDLTAYYFREYIDGDIRSSGNQATVVMDKNHRLVHYLSYGKRNPLTLAYKPNWSKETAIKKLVRQLGKNIGGINDNYDLIDFYYQVPAFEITRATDKQYKPQFMGEYKSDKNVYMVYVRHDGDYVPGQTSQDQAQKTNEDGE